LHDLADVDVGIIGSAHFGVPNPQTIEELEKVKWAARYLKCGHEINGDRCKPNRYNGTCWLDRPDGFVPPAKQDSHPGGRAGWHPGNREHQIQGRTIAWLLLQAIHDVFTEWKAAEDYALPDDAWHVTTLYDNTRSKIAALDPSMTACKALVELNMTYFCTVPFQVRSSSCDTPVKIPFKVMLMTPVIDWMDCSLAFGSAFGFLCYVDRRASQDSSHPIFLITSACRTGRLGPNLHLGVIQLLPISGPSCQKKC
jgi:hypothetical protein